MPGRNDPCPCGSGKKFKKCCVDTYVAPVRPPSKRNLALETKAKSESSKPKLELQPGFDQEKVNAYHEAGHAVVGALEGPGTEITTIDRDKVKELTGQPMIGYTNYIGAGKTGVETDTYLIMALAGVTSEAMHATNGMVSSKEDDFDFASEILDRAGYKGEAKKTKFLQARVRTQEMISKYNKEIQIVGDALVERKTLNAEEIRALLGVNGNLPSTEQR
jgi:hypothetical protein